jgi:uncharacterized protein involved in exopolysaccharide biosynthesis
MNRLRWLLLGALILAAVAGTVLVTTATAKFESTAQVLLKRAQLERAGGASEESKNRWVWVRDGMELKHHLVSEGVLAGVVQQIAVKGLRADPAMLRKSLTVHYSGGDDNLFTIRVRDTDAARSIAVVDALLSAFPAIATGERQTALTASIRALESAGSAGESESAKARRAEIIETLKSDLAFANAENANRIVIIERPTSAKKIWPRPLFIYTAAGVIALFLACLIAVVLRREVA